MASHPFPSTCVAWVIRVDCGEAQRRGDPEKMLYTLCVSVPVSVGCQITGGLREQADTVKGGSLAALRQAAGNCQWTWDLGGKTGVLGEQYRSG